MQCHTQWSFGVTCWEVFSLGRTPYPSIPGHELVNVISSGVRLEKPSLCPQPVYVLPVCIKAHTVIIMIASRDQCYLGTIWLHIAGSCCQEIVLHSLNLAHSFQTSGKNIIHTYDSVTCLETVTTINTQYVSAVLCFVPPASLLSSDVILLISICTCICGRVATGSYVRLSKRGFHYRVLLICDAVCQVQ